MTTTRPNCEHPTACVAKGAGHCRSCNIRAATKANWQDPAFREFMSARWARHCVREAGLPLLKKHVARAKALLGEGLGIKVTVDALRQEQRTHASGADAA